MWCSKSYKLRIRVCRGPAVTLKLDLKSKLTLTGCTPIHGLGTERSKQLLGDYYQDEIGTINSAYKQGQQSACTDIIYHCFYGLKLNMPITLPGTKAQRKRRFPKTTSKKAVHIDAHICINKKKKSNLLPQAQVRHCANSWRLHFKSALGKCR